MSPPQVRNISPGNASIVDTYATNARRLWRRGGGDRGIRRAGRNRDARGIGQSAWLNTSCGHLTGETPIASMHCRVRVTQGHDFVRFYIFPALKTGFV